MLQAQCTEIERFSCQILIPAYRTKILQLQMIVIQMINHLKQTLHYMLAKQPLIGVSDLNVDIQTSKLSYGGKVCLEITTQTLIKEGDFNISGIDL